MPARKSNSESSVWETLSAINCDGHTEEKNGFTYLSWAWAWQTLKEHYPQARFEKLGTGALADGSMFVTVRVWIPFTDFNLEDVTETLPVLNYSNKPIQNPNCFEVNSAYQRCLVKCLAYMGLGMYIYQGEIRGPTELSVTATDLETGDIKTEKVSTEDLSHVADIFVTFMGGRTLDGLRQFWSQNEQALTQLETLDPEQHKRVKDAFMKEAESLKAKEGNK